ncbi:MAG TPA: outer membrane beta-barrel protein [Bacteroidales bacterium]|jgi:hypothetical protein|nr:outer membrane beta-barrel protein [Bacteroidales bacterium]
MKTCLIYRIVITVLIMISGIFINLHAQEAPACAEKLQTARILFEKGQVQQVPGLISECLKSGFNREESIEAFKLIIQCYLFDEEFSRADSAMLSFLKKYPEYELSPTDHSSFVGLFNNYVSRVVIQLSVHLGSNLPFIIVTQSNLLFGTDTKKEYSSQTLNFFGAIEAKYRLSSKMEANVEVGYSQISFTSTESGIFAKSGLTEKYTRLEIPVGLTYDIRQWGKFTPYARLSGGPAITLSAKATGAFDPTDINNHGDKPGPQMDISSSRISIDLFIQAGGGIKFKVPKGFIFAEVRSNFGFRNQPVFNGYNSPNDDPAFYYMHSNDIFRINTLNFNLGYTKIFYKPVRKEEQQ